MKKFLNISTAVAMVLCASVAAAQNGSDVTGGTVSNTVGGVFVPTASGGVNSGGGVSAALLPPAPPSTPVSVPPAGGAAVGGVMSGAPQAVANFSQTLGTSGVPAGAAAGIANALQQIGTSPTAGGVQTAIATWNAAIQSMTPAQVQALVSTPAGRAAVVTMLRANAAVLRAAAQAR